MTARRTVITTQNVTAAVDVLSFLKSRYNYSKLSKLLGISQSTLVRYLHRRTVPRPRVAREIVRRALEIIRPEELVREYVEHYRDGWAVRLAADGQALKLLAYHALGTFEGTRVVGAANLDPQAVPLTVAFSLVTGCGIVMIGERPMCDTEEYFPVTYRPKGDYSSRHLWVPSVIRAFRDGVLVFASSVGSPSPLTDFISFLQDRGIRCSGIYSLHAREEVWNSIRFPVGCRKKAVLVER
ncbi:MAG: hypothetical protein ABDH63_02170 [Candidatus Caldarchaeales archaeon]